MVQPACGQLVCSVDQVLTHEDDDEDYNNDDNEDDNEEDNEDDKDK